MVGKPKETSFQRRYTDVQGTHVKVFSITNHQRNVNQDHGEIPPIPVRMAIIKKSLWV